MGRDPRVVHQQGDGAKPRPGIPDHGLHGSAVRHIRLDGNGVMALGLDLFHQRPGGVLPLQIIDADVPASAGKLQSYRSSNPTGSAGNQCGLFH